MVLTPSPATTNTGVAVVKRISIIILEIIFVFVAQADVVRGSPQTRKRAPELTGGRGWLNTDKPLSLAALKGKIVLLDFWTYGCINCLHNLPDLEQLEKKYANQLVVIGVHSGRYDNEKDTENIRQTILRHQINHPVYNDAGFAVWRAFGVSAW